MKAVLWGVCLIAIATAGLAVAAEPPQAEAGLDQTAVEGTTVYLDAGGSLSPDGEVTDYEWTIETPSGATTTPDCPACERTFFVPTEVGTYAVTLTVTDDRGQTDSDTMYVEVYEAMEVELVGSDVVPVNETVPFGIQPERDSPAYDSYSLAVDGLEHTRVDAQSSPPWIVNVTFESTGTKTVTGQVLDTDGFTAADSMRVEVVSPDDGDSSSTSSSSGDGQGLADTESLAIQQWDSGETYLLTDQFHIDQEITVFGETIEFAGGELMEMSMENDRTVGVHIEQVQREFEKHDVDIDDVAEFMYENDENKVDDVSEDDYNDWYQTEQSVSSSSSDNGGSYTRDQINRAQDHSSANNRNEGANTLDAISDAGNSGSSNSSSSPSSGNDSGGSHTECTPAGCF